MKTDDSAIVLTGIIVMVVLWRLDAIVFRRLLVIVSGVSLLIVIFLITIAMLRSNVKTIDPTSWGYLNGLDFEKQINEWLKLLGYNEVKTTEYFDQGLDIIAYKPGVLLGVQVKRSSRPVGVSAVRAAVTGLKVYGCTQAMVVTNSSFTKSAIKLALANDCKLVDGLELKSAIVQLSTS